MGLACSALNLACCGCSTLMSAARCCGSATEGNADRQQKNPRTVSVCTRIIYVLFLFAAFIIALVLKNAPSIVAKIPGATMGCDNANEHVVDVCRGHYGVFRMSFVSVIFFGIHILLSTGCFGSAHFRVALLTQAMGVRLILFVAMVVGSLFIPNTFFAPYGYAAIVGAAFFLLVQVIVLVDFAHSVNLNWRTRAEEEGAMGFLYLLLIASILLLAGGLAIIIYLYVGYGGGPQLNPALTTVTLAMCIIAVAASLKVEGGSLFTAAVVSIYLCVQTFSALASGAMDCHSADAGATMYPALAISPTAATVMTCVITALSLIWACVSSGGSHESFAVSPRGSNGDVCDDEDQETVRPFLFFFVVMTLGAFYMGMVLTGWSVTEGDVDTGALYSCVDSGIGAMWAKIATVWLAFLLYVWTVIAPKVLDRDFGPV